MRAWAKPPRAPGHAVAAVAGAVGGRYRIGAQHPARRLRAPGRAATSRSGGVPVGGAGNHYRRRAFGDRCRRRAFAGSAVGNAAAPVGAGRLGAHRGHRAVRGDGARRDHLAVEGRLSTAAAPDAVQQGSVHPLDRGGAGRPGGGPVGRPDVGGVGRKRAVRQPRRGRVEAGTLRQVQACGSCAAGRPSRRTGVPAGLPRRSAARRRAARCGCCLLRAAQPGHLGGIVGPMRWRRPKAAA